jgi:hypothetical protein
VLQDEESKKLNNENKTWKGKGKKDKEEVKVAPAQWGSESRQEG